jgi:Secretion system C-terminal sorting domain/Dockerin type I domain
LDFVEYEGTATPIKNVVINNWFYEDEYLQSNSTSDANGRFQGVVLDGMVHSYIQRPGLGHTIAEEEWSYAEWINGVSTWDVVLINRHILQTQLLTSGYRQIAADVNRSGTITAFDLVDIKRLILGIPFNPAMSDESRFNIRTGPWLFVPEYIPLLNNFHVNPFTLDVNGDNTIDNFINYISPVGAAPFINTPYTILNGTNGVNGFDGTKAGDVSGNSNPNLTGEDCNQFMAMLPPPSVSAGTDEIIQIEILANQFTDIEAFQMGFKVSYEHFELISIDNKNLTGFSQFNNTGTTYLDQNKLSVLWYHEQGLKTTLSNGTPLFSITLKAKQPITSFNNIFYLHNDVLPSALYNSNGCIENVVLAASAAIQQRSTTSEPVDFNRVDVYPNPFSDNLIVGLSSIEKGSGIIEVTDLVGRMIDQQEITFSDGYERINLLNSQHYPKGLLFIRVRTNQHDFSTRIMKETTE